MKEKPYTLPQISKEALVAIKKGVEEKHSVSNLEELGVSQRLINLLESNGIRDLSVLMTHKKKIYYLFLILAKDSFLFYFLLCQSTMS